MATQRPNELQVSFGDLKEHIIKFGLDMYPPLDLRSEATRAQDLFLQLQSKWPDYYQEQNFTPMANEFGIFATYDVGVRDKAKVPTLLFMPRGPVFTFPVRFLVSSADQNYGSTNPRKLFDGGVEVLRNIFPGLSCLRIGLVRELIFSTGNTPAAPFISSRFGTFPSTTPKGGNALASFVDDRCNVRVNMEPIEIHRRQGSPAMKNVISDQVEYAIRVRLDVNNNEMKPQSDDDIDMTLQRAEEIWPDQLINFLNWRA